MMSVITQKLVHYADLVKFEHTIFALPFALSALLLAAWPTWPPVITVLWVILAMVGGRTYAMGLNRIIDKDIDGQNPRTQMRAIPAGRVKLAEAWGLTLLSLGLMTYATAQLPILCLQLLPLAVVILTAYSYIKRFSNLAHMVLGLALGSSAIGGWVALTGDLTLPAIGFGAAVLFWVAGFDIIYACQDIAFDREAGLHSIPARLGIAKALWVSRVCHFLTPFLLIASGWGQPFSGWGYWGAVALISAMLIYEHRLVSADDMSKVDEAFFAVNGQISCGVFLLILLERLVLVWRG